MVLDSKQRCKLSGKACTKSVNGVNKCVAGGGMRAIAGWMMGVSVGRRGELKVRNKMETVDCSDQSQDQLDQEVMPVPLALTPFPFSLIR